MENALLLASIAGLNELITRLRAQDYWVAATIVLAASIGALFGYFHVQGLPDALSGAVAGLGASGIITALGHVGNKSVATPTPLTK